MSDSSKGLEPLDQAITQERGNPLTLDTLRKSARGEDVHRAQDTADLFTKLRI